MLCGQEWSVNVKSLHWASVSLSDKLRKVGSLIAFQIANDKS